MKKIRHFFYHAILLLFSSFDVAADWKSNLGDSYRQMQDSLWNTTASESNAAPSAKTAAAPSFLKDIPVNWEASFDKEPVFNSELYIVQTGKTNSQTIVLIHGLGQVGLRDWLTVIPVLESQYHVLTLDLPGFGRSAAPEGRYSPTNYAKIIHWLVNKYAKGQVIVVGHSMGGAVALRYSSDYPAEVKKLILVDAAGILERTAFMKHSAELPINVEQAPNRLKRITAQIRDFGSSVVELSTSVPDFTKIINASDMIWNKSFAGRPNLNAALALINEDFTQAIKTLPHSTAIIWGGLDNVAPLRTGETLVGRLPHATLAVIESSHHVPMSSNAEEFSRLLLASISTNEIPKVTREPSPSQGPLVCKNKNGLSYTGRYESITIDNCTGITLEDVQATQVTIRNSLVEFVNTQIETDQTALAVYESVLVVTNATIRGRIGIRAEGSRLDLAGVSVYGQPNAIEIGSASRFIFSVSDLSSRAYTGNVHGVYHYKNTSLDAMLAKKRH